MAYFSRPQSRSAAVRIVAPSNGRTQDYNDQDSPKPSKNTTQRQCRNVLIYGSCKFEGKGCAYYHPSRFDTPSHTPDLPTTTPRSDTPASIPAQAVNAPVFIPKSLSSTPALSEYDNYSHLSSPQPSLSTNDYQEQSTYSPYTYTTVDSESDMPPTHYLDAGYSSAGEAQMQYGNEYNGATALDQFYQTSPAFIRQPLIYHLYSQPLPRTPAHNFFVSDEIREELTKRSEISLTAPTPGLLLPDEIQGYHTLVPIDSVNSERYSGLNMTVYRATSSMDGRQYVLRRIENFRLTHEAALQSVELWSRIRHPNIVQVREAFTSRAFNDNSLIVVYDYHPGSQTLADVHFKPRTSSLYPHSRLGMQTQVERVPERTVWSYFYQIASAIKAVHDAGLAVRSMDITKIVVTGQNRIRFSACGLFDVLTYDARQDMSTLQQEDLRTFATVILTLCCGSTPNLVHLHKSIESVGHYYSQEIKGLLSYIFKHPPITSIQQVLDAFNNKVLEEVDAMRFAVDRYETELMSELENGRLIRLLCKFGFINERPEFDRDLRWSETGDRYIIKLFRDYVFHQIDEIGNPVVNLSHVLTCLNKVDAGTDERIMLVSRDEQSCLIVSYREIKSCIETAFGDLSRGSR